MKNGFLPTIMYYYGFIHCDKYTMLMADVNKRAHGYILDEGYMGTLCAIFTFFKKAVK